MKTARKLLSYAGSVWLLTLSQAVNAQPAPKAPAAAPKAPAAAPNAPATAPNAPAADSAAPVAPAASPAPAAPSVTNTAPAAAGAESASAEANVALPPPAPVALPPAPQPVIEPAPVQASPVTTEPTAEVLPQKLAIAKSGWLKIGGLAQGWFVIDDGTAIANNPAGGSFDTTMYFRVRRAQLILSGEVVKERVGFFMLLDGAKTVKFSQIPATGTPTGYKPSTDDTAPLLDFWVKFASSVADVSIGQWKSPISYEGTTSSSELLLPERAYTTRYFGDNYDAGLKVEKKFEYVKYSLQMLQGAPGANQIDKNRQKDLALRLEFMPMKGIMVGGAGLTSVGQRTTQTTTRDIVEADVAFDMYDLIARGELLWGWSGLTRDGAERVKSRGMAASFGYTIAKTVQPVARISYLNVDIPTDGTPAGQPLYTKFSLGTDEIRAYEFGINYLVDGKHAKIMAAYSYLDMDNIPYRQQFILAGQAAF